MACKVDKDRESVSQFIIEKWEAKSTNILGSSDMRCVKITSYLNFQFFSIFMVTYLPTILMNIINQATNYITGDSKYDMIYTINITSLMVLASIYLSVANSLPSTPNIKPVEVWLLFNLAYPFFVVLVNIILQVIYQY